MILYFSIYTMLSIEKVLQPHDHFFLPPSYHPAHGRSYSGILLKKPYPTDKLFKADTSRGSGCSLCDTSPDFPLACFG